MEFSRQEYWSGLLVPSLRDLPNLEFEPNSPTLAGGFFSTNATWEVIYVCVCVCVYLKLAAIQHSQNISLNSLFF